MTDRIAIADIYERAADSLIVDGWVQGTSRGPGGERCWIGGVGHACAKLNRTGLYADALDVGARHLGGLDGQHDKITNWNDAKGRTVDDVVDKMRLIAKDLRNTTKEQESK